MPSCERSSSKADRVPGAGFAHYPVTVHKIAGCQAIAPAPWMVRTNNHHQLVPRNRRAREMLVLHRAFNEAQFRRAVFDRCRNLRRVADRETDVDLGIGLPKRNQMARKPITGDGLTCLHGKRAPLQAAKFVQREFGRFHPRQYRFRARQKNMAGLGQLDAAADAIEELCAVPRLQCRNRMARCGLREVQRSSSLRDVLPLGDRNKNAKLLESHGDLLFDGNQVQRIANRAFGWDGRTNAADIQSNY